MNVGLPSEWCDVDEVNGSLATCYAKGSVGDYCGDGQICEDNLFCSSESDSCETS